MVHVAFLTRNDSTLKSGLPDFWPFVFNLETSYSVSCFTFVLLEVPLLRSLKHQLPSLTKERLALASGGARICHLSQPRVIILMNGGGCSLNSVI